MISTPALFPGPDIPRTRAETGSGRPASRHLTLACLLLSLSAVSCEHNVDLGVRIPRWETATSPLGVLDVHQRAPQASAEGPWSAEDCGGFPDRVVISFFLASERDTPIGEGDRLRVGGEVLRPEAARLMNPLDVTQSIAVSLLVLEGPGDPVPLSGDILAVRFRPRPALPSRLVLLHDHGREAGERDPSDERIAAYAELLPEALCLPEPPLGCLLGDDTHLSLYRLGGGAVAPLVVRSRNRSPFESALADLRHTNEAGASPYFLLSDNVRPGGIPTGFAECDGSDSLSRCAPTVMLVAGASPTTDTVLSHTAFPPNARVLVAGLVDRPDLRRLACQTGGFFMLADRPSDLRLIANRSVSDIPDYTYGFVRRALLTLGGHWEAEVSLAGIPTDLDLSTPHRLSGTLSVTLGDQTVSTELRSVVGGY